MLLKNCVAMILQNSHNHAWWWFSLVPLQWWIANPARPGREQR